MSLMNKCDICICKCIPLISAVLSILPKLHARAVPISTATNPAGMRAGRFTRPIYWIRIKAKGIYPTSGSAKIRKQKSIEMKVIAIPANVANNAARGVTRFTQPARNAPANSMSPEPRQAANPTFQASSTSWV